MEQQQHHQRSPAARRRNSLIEPHPENHSMGAASQEAPEDNQESSLPEASLRRSSEVPVPAPRQKSPLLKQRAVLVENESVEQQPPQRVPTPVKRQAPPPPLIQHPSDRSDSGIVTDVGSRSPKTSQSSGATSRQSSSNSRNSGPPAESQDSGSDLSDSEVEPSSGVVFRKVTLKRRKRRDAGGVTKAHSINDARRPRIFVDWEDSCCPPAVTPPWNTFSLPRIPPSHSRSSPVSQQQLAWDGSCDQLTRTNSSDSLWWDAATCRSSVATGVWLAASEGLGLAPGLSRSLGAVTDSGANGSPPLQWSASEAPFKRRGSARFEWRRASFRGSLRVKRRRHRCRLSASYEDLRVSSPEFEEDFPLDFGGVRNADSYSDILGHVTDKIVPEGDEYRIVFISSSSSKSSGLNSADGDAISSGDDLTGGYRLMDDAEWDPVSAPCSPPPLPSAPPPSKRQTAQSCAAVVDDDIFAYFRGFADAEWKETSLIVAEEESDGDDLSKRSPPEDLSPVLRPFAFTRTNSSRSSGERSIGEQSFFNQIFRDQPSPESTEVTLVRFVESAAVTLVESATLAEVETSRCGSSSDDDPADTVDSSDDECAFGSYDVNVSFSEEESEAAAPTSGDEAPPSDGYLTESESMVDFVVLSEEETDNGSGMDGPSDEETSAEASFLDGLAIPDVQHNSIRRLLDDVDALTPTCKDAPEMKESESRNSGGDATEESIEQSVSVSPNNNEISGKVNPVSDSEEEGEKEEEKTDVAVGANESVVDASVGAITGEMDLDNDENSRAESGVETQLLLTENESCSLPETLDCSGSTIAKQDVNVNDLLVGQEVTCEQVPKESDMEIDASSACYITANEESLGGQVDLGLVVEEQLGEDQTLNSENLPKLANEEEHMDQEDVLPFVIAQPIMVDDEASVSVLPTPKAASCILHEYQKNAVTLQYPESGELVQILEEDDAKTGDLFRDKTEESEGLSSKQDITDIDTEVEDVEEHAEVDEDMHGETSSDGEKLESDTDSLDTVIEGESFRRMRQMAIRQKLLEVNSEFDSVAPPSEQKPPEDTFSLTAENQATETKLISKPNLQELVAQSRALAASFKQSEEEASRVGQGDDVAGTSVLEKYFVSSLEHMAPPIFNRSRSRQPMAVPKTDDTTAASPSPTPSGADEILIESYHAGSEDEFTDSCSETHSENDFSGPIVSGDDSETTFDEDDDTSSTASTSSDEGSACLRIAPRPCVPVADDAWYRLDMSLHTIMEESCEESESERERHLEERKRTKNRSESAERSQLERYFHFTFDEPVSEPLADGTSTKSAEAAADVTEKASLTSLRLSMDESEFSDDTFSETESSVYSECNNRDGIEVDDEELARLASSRLEKYFLTGLLELQVGYPENGASAQDEEVVTTPTPDAEQPSPALYTFSKKPEESVLPSQQKTGDKTSPPDSSSKEETDEDIPFEKNDGCDTIKRKKKSHLELEDEDLASAIVALGELEVIESGTLEENRSNVTNSELSGAVEVLEPSELVSCSMTADNNVETQVVEKEKDDAITKEANQSSVVNPEAATISIPAEVTSEILEKAPSESENLKDTLNKLNLDLPKDPPRSLPTDILDAELGGSTQLLSWDPSYYGYGEATNPGLVGRGLTLDWKQQSRDSGFIGSSDDLLQDSAVDETKTDTKEAAIGDAVVAAATIVPPPLPLQQSTSANPFGLFRSSSTRSNFYAASTTSDDEAQYIVNQLMGHIAKSMSRSPQLARAKPPEIEVFETELTKLMQTVPGIDATVKEIVEELSSTDYCSDSYESSDYAGSDQEAAPAAEITKQALYNLQLRRNDSWRSIASTASKGSSVGAAEDGQKLPEETMYIYQRFMDSLAKMTEQASEEAKTGEGSAAASVNGGGGSAATSRGSSPPTPVKMLHHIRSKLTSLMREVHADKSPQLSGGGDNGAPRRIIAWSKPSSGSGSAAGDELSLSSTSSANFDSEDSPTDTELSMDSTDESTAAALTQAHARIRTAAAATPLKSSHHDRGSGDGLERWSSDMTIVDDDVRYSSVHKSEPILSLPDSAGDDQRRNSRDLSILSKTLPSSRYGHPSQASISKQTATAPRPRSIGSLTHLITSNKNQQQCRSSKSEWEVWRDDDDGDASKPGSASSASSLVSPPRAPYKHKSCDMLPSARSKSELRATAAATSRDRKKHGFAFMMRQKSGSSMSLRDGAATPPDGKSIKQQIQFRSQLHLKSGKEDATEAPPQQQQQSRSSSLHRLFGAGKASKKGLGTAPTGSVPSVKNCWSSPDVGVDVTTATGIDLSDGEESGGGKGSRPSSTNLHYGANALIGGANVTSIYVPSGAYSTQDLSATANPRAKASTLPRAASSDLHANVSFLHKPPACRTLTRSTNTLPHSYTLLVPQQETAIKTPPQRQLSITAGIARTPTATTTTPTTNVTSFGTKSVVQVVPPESPKGRREIQSWPVTDGTGDVSKNEVTLVSVSGQGMAPRAKSLSPPAVTVKYGSHIPNIQVAECPERPGLRGSGASSHTGSSDPDSMTEEDIDRLVALHKNRSLSSLGVCSESMSSVYSAAGGGHYGTVTVRGEVQFGLSYNYVSGALEVHIKQCRDLAPVDAKRNRSDPYVKVYLLPDKSKSGKRKTRVKKHTLNPLFNEILKFHVTISELETRTLWMTVWHSDMFGRNEFLGEVTLPMGYEAWDDTSPKWYLLQERLGPPEEVYSYKGDLVLALKFVPPDVTMQKKGRHSRGSLHVLVKEARNLMAVCANGTSDPFCKCYLLPDKGKSNKQKTHVVKRSCNPKWNHTFVYDDISLEQLRERCLELTVWDYDRLTSNDFLGGVRLSMGTGRHQGKKVDWIDSRAEEISMWQAMLENPNIWVDATILLRPSMDHRQASTW